MPGAESAALDPEWTEPETGMAFVLIPGGKFEMGLGFRLVRELPQ